MRVTVCSTQTLLMHVERVFKLYTGLTCSYGLSRTFLRKDDPVTGAAIIIASPALWTFYAFQDFVDWRLGSCNPPKSNPIHDN